MKTLFSLIVCLIIAGQSYSQNHLAQAKPMGSDEWGYINPKGQFVLNAQYRVCNAFGSDGLAAIYDKRGKEFFFIDTKGAKLSTDAKGFRLKNIFGFGTKGFEDGMAMIEIAKKWGYLDASGKLAIPTKYDDANEFNGGYATVKTGGKWVVIDKKGTETALPENVADAKPFSEDLAPVKVGDLWGFVATDGSMPIKAAFKSVGYFTQGLAWAKTEANQVGFIDKRGNWVIDAKYEVAKEFSADGLARVKKSGTWMFVDTKGNELNAASADTYGDFSNGLAYAKSVGKVGFIDKQGNLVIAQNFDEVRDFKNGYAAAKQGDKWGFIDIKGNWVIEPQFESVKDFELAGH